MKHLKPFFTYYGGKYRAAPKYPESRWRSIVEPFAGSAGYSLRHYQRRVTLIEKNHKVAALWRYLIRVKSKEILSLRTQIEHVDDLGNVPEEAAWLVGFWLNKGNSSPCYVPSRWMRDGLRPKSWWGYEIRHRIASQVDAIRHWRIIEGEYNILENLEATWFIDPPYNNAAGKRYPEKFSDYSGLASWCINLWGQVIVCEDIDATWLPFKPLYTHKAMNTVYRHRSRAEAIYHQEFGAPLSGDTK